MLQTRPGMMFCVPHSRLPLGHGCWEFPSKNPWIAWIWRAMSPQDPQPPSLTDRDAKTGSWQTARRAPRNYIQMSRGGSNHRSTRRVIQLPASSQGSESAGRARNDHKTCRNFHNFCLAFRPPIGNVEWEIRGGSRLPRLPVADRTTRAD